MGKFLVIPLDETLARPLLSTDDADIAEQRAQHQAEATGKPYAVFERVCYFETTVNTERKI